MYGREESSLIVIPAPTSPATASRASVASTREGRKSRCGAAATCRAIRDRRQRNHQRRDVLIGTSPFFFESVERIRGALVYRGRGKKGGITCGAADLLPEGVRSQPFGTRVGRCEPGEMRFRLRFEPGTRVKRGEKEMVARMARERGTDFVMIARTDDAERGRRVGRLRQYVGCPVASHFDLPDIRSPALERTRKCPARSAEDSAARDLLV